MDLLHPLSQVYPETGDSIEYVAKPSDLETDYEQAGDHQSTPRR